MRSAVAALAGAYSKGRELDKIDIDYVQKKEVKKPNGAKPGFVVYYTNFSMKGTAVETRANRNFALTTLTYYF